MLPSLLAVCDDVLVEPLDPAHPSLAELGPLSDLQDEKLAVEINAIIADGALPSNAFVPVEVRTSSGDEVTAELTPMLCDDFTEPGRFYRCRQLFVRIAEGHRVADLVPLLDELDAQWLSMVRSFAGGRVYVFSGKVSTALDRIEDHPAVERAQTAWRVTTIPEAARAGLTAVVPTTNAADVGHLPGVLTIVHGDSSVASYVQPDGTVLRTAGAVVRCADFLHYCP